jgi:S1-C subfamily serine protease
MVTRLITFVFAAALCTCAVRADSLPDTVASVRASIVAVGTIMPTRQPPVQFAGTGFVVGSGRHVITNAHVLPARLDSQKREQLAVISGRGQGRVHRATVVGRDTRHDLALLSIDEGPLPAMALGQAERVREGALYAFTGYPIGPVLGLFPVTHRGIVSAISPIAIPQQSSQSLDLEMLRRLGKPFDVFQLDATAYPGNSGSPLYDPATGAVVGVINKVFVKESKEKILSLPSGITYAIPVTHVRALMQTHRVKP